MMTGISYMQITFHFLNSAMRKSVESLLSRTNTTEETYIKKLKSPEIILRT